MNRLSTPFSQRLPAPLRAILATALLTLSTGEAAAVPAWDDSFAEPTVFEQNFPATDDAADPASSTVEWTDDQISVALFGEPVESPTLLAGFDPLQTP